MSSDIIEFTRRRDLVFKKELGQGACGRTVLLFDDVIEQYFVCKKFSPIAESMREELFHGFVREIKLLHTLNHPNIVRVFNYYLYPDKLVGYILMEEVKGSNIEDFIIANPSQIDSLFTQVIDGFHHLEKNEILHRDIRPHNILVSNDGEAKIIDFGFGKNVSKPDDFKKSITLNWWCEPPIDFESSKYDYSTETYFVGKLFEKIITDNGIENFSFTDVLRQMCERDPSNRNLKFSTIRETVRSKKFEDTDFNIEEILAYRGFSRDLESSISKIEQDASYYEDPAQVLRKIESTYKSVMLEEFAPNNAPIISCFINGGYYYSKRSHLSVEALRAFLNLLHQCHNEKRLIILSNLYTRLSSIPRYAQEEFRDDDIPF